VKADRNLGITGYGESKQKTRADYYTAQKATIRTLISAEVKVDVIAPRIHL
jgi:hypothetical protein